MMRPSPGVAYAVRSAEMLSVLRTRISFLSAPSRTHTNATILSSAPQSSVSLRAEDYADAELPFPMQRRCKRQRSMTLLRARHPSEQSYRRDQEFASAAGHDADSEH